ncbi:MAG: hypothetical protein Q4G42_06455 [Neisseria sp.]|nr:hypothetical protein [Neisseria sp.]
MWRNRYVFLAAIWFAASVYFLFFKAQGTTPPPFAHFDKVAHGGLFFGQTWLAGKIWLAAGKALPWRGLLLALAIWAGVSEVLQAVCTLDRTGEIADAAADMVGALAALYFLKQSKHGQNLS